MFGKKLETPERLSLGDVKNRMRCREALRRLGSGVDLVRGDELAIVANSLEADADTLDAITQGRAVGPAPLEIKEATKGAER